MKNLLSVNFKNFFENHTWSLKSSMDSMLPCAASMDTAMNTFQLDPVVHGDHIYKNIWNSMLGEELECTYV